ncbi:Uncharacterized protein FWK35_00021519 [Aphis craccivora]|uniref:Uncharacterized protein n=1 Tax=Aphis craccivora TaxID=307492 RepID=A0A6G0YZD4_APHCR|nr:Uncharacterized protein FWK35_00021519 [Aphis craccivora]
MDALTPITIEPFSDNETLDYIILDTIDSIITTLEDDEKIETKIIQSVVQDVMNHILMVFESPSSVDGEAIDEAPPSSADGDSIDEAPPSPADGDAIDEAPPSPADGDAIDEAPPSPADGDADGDVIDEAPPSPTDGDATDDKSTVVIGDGGGDFDGCTTSTAKGEEIRNSFGDLVGWLDPGVTLQQPQCAPRRSRKRLRQAWRSFKRVFRGVLCCCARADV